MLRFVVQHLPEDRSSHPEVNKDLLTAMLDMGISHDRSRLALLNSDDASVEAATNWLFNMPDSDLEQLLGCDPDVASASVEHGSQQYPVTMQVSTKYPI